MLDCVRCGSPTEETVQTLENSVIIICSVQNKFNELQSSGQSPVCLFPTKNACEDFNVTVLNSLDTKVHEIDCIDEVDETQSMCKWHKKAADYVKKLNKDCNTATTRQDWKPSSLWQLVHGSCCVETLIRRPDW